MSDEADAQQPEVRGDELAWRRWRLALGGDADDPALSPRDRRLDKAMTALYGDGEKKRGSLAGSAPRVARWLGDIREFFPASVVQVVQKDAFERLGLKRMLLEPEFLAGMEADVHLVADLVGLGAAMPEATKETARRVIKSVVDRLMEKLAAQTVQALRGALNRSRRTRRPRQSDIDWPRTIRANLRTYDPDRRTLVPEKLVGYGRKGRRADLDTVIMCVDQSGSMATSVVYASIFSAVMASIPALATRLVVFDTVVADLSDKLADPVEVLFGTQLGGGTDINAALAYCQAQVAEPSRTHLVLITDLYEGGDRPAMLQRCAEIVAAGINLVVLLALSDDGRPSYDAEAAGIIAGLGAPVFACTPDMFPDLMATALKRGDLAAWAAGRDIRIVAGA